jgi:hypothetical protein
VEPCAHVGICCCVHFGPFGAGGGQDKELQRKLQREVDAVLGDKDTMTLEDIKGTQ